MNPETREYIELNPDSKPVNRHGRPVIGYVSARIEKLRMQQEDYDGDPEVYEAREREYHTRQSQWWEYEQLNQEDHE